jgi:phosphoribosylanthranilate isomerase
MRIKICGMFRDQDIDFVNEARPDYIGFVFAKSKRQVSPPLAQYLRFRLADGIVPVGVFVNASINDIAELFHNGTISIAQLHGDEDESYITKLIKECADKKLPNLKVIKTIKISKLININSPNASFDDSQLSSFSKVADYFLIDSDAGSGKTFDWKLLNTLKISKPWFLAGGVNIDNMAQAMAFAPFAIDVSSGAETDGIKNREKILQLTAMTRKGNIQ